MVVGCVLHLADTEALIPMILYRDALSIQGQKLDLWKVPLPDGHLTGRDFVQACQARRMKPVCTGDRDTCATADMDCESLAVEAQEGCGVPLQGTVKLLGYRDNTDPHLKNMCVYVAPGNGYDDGFLCGPEASYDGYGLGCNAASGNRYVLCAGSSKLDEQLVNQSIEFQRDSQEVKHLRQKNAWLHDKLAKVNRSVHERLHTMHQEVKDDEAETNEANLVAVAAVLGLACLLCRRTSSSQSKAVDGPISPARVPLLRSTAAQPPVGFQPSLSVYEYNDREGHKIRCVRVVAPGRRIIDNGRSINGSVKVEIAEDGCSTQVHLKLVKEADVPSFAVPVVQHGVSDADGAWEKTLTLPDGTWERLEPSTSLALDAHGVLQIFLVRKLPPRESEITIASHPAPCQHFAIGSASALSENASSVDWLEVANGANVVDEVDGTSSIGVSEALGEALTQAMQATSSVASLRGGSDGAMEEQYGGVATLVPAYGSADEAARLRALAEQALAASASSACIQGIPIPATVTMTAEMFHDDGGSERSWVTPTSLGTGSGPETNT